MARTAETVAEKAHEVHALFEQAGVIHTQVVSELMGRTRQCWYNLRAGHESAWKDTAVVVIMLQLRNLLRHMLDTDQLPVKVLPSKQANTDLFIRVYKERFLGIDLE